MKNRRVTIILIGLFFLGLLIVLYPTISNHWNRRHSSRAIASYQEAMEEMEEEDNTVFWEAAERYNAHISSYGKLKELTEEDMGLVSEEGEQSYSDVSLLLRAYMDLCSHFALRRYDLKYDIRGREIPSERLGYGRR